MGATETMAAVRAALLKYPGAAPLKTAADAQKVAAKAARVAGRILTADLPSIPANERHALVVSVVREINRVANDAAQQMQRSRAAAYGEQSLGTAQPKVDALRADHLATYADGLYMDGAEVADPDTALMDVLENNARMCVDDLEEALADARYNMGMKSVIVRMATGANSCEWCLSAAGEYEYGPTMDKTMAFGRHNNCDCVIEYHPAGGKVETVRNYRRSK